METESNFNVGVLGATGYIGEPYRREIRQCANARIVALCSRRRDLLEAAGKVDEADVVTTDWRKVVSHPDVNVVLIATPDALHHEAVMACAAEGKHVICEKPLGVNAREAQEMHEAYASKPHLAHFVPFWVRYADAMQRAKAVLNEGLLGEIRGVIYRWHNPRPQGMPYTWRDDPKLSAAGSIADVGSHAYDTVRWLLQSGAQRVLAHAEAISPRYNAGDINLTEALELGTKREAGMSKDDEQRTPDYASVAWEFSNGAVGALILSHASYFRKGLAPELEIHGSIASLTLERIKGHVILAKGTEEPKVIATLPDLAQSNRFQSFVFPALQAQIRGQPDPDAPTMEDGWHVQQFTDAVAASAQQGLWMAV